MPVSALVEILDQQLGLAAEDPAFGIDLLDRQLAADLLVLAELGIGAGQRIVEAELDLVGGASGNRKGRCQLRDTGGRSRLDDSPTVELSRLNPLIIIISSQAWLLCWLRRACCGCTRAKRHPYGHRARRKESGFP